MKDTVKIYLVGGAVRDMLLGIEPKDRDYVVVGATEQDMVDDGFKKVGADFPVFLHPVTGEEYALARSERKTGPGYNGFDVVFDPSVTLEQDLIRRDLTINSMAVDTATKQIIDPFGGRDDLEKKILRHTSEAFAEDPVRVLRVARFCARYHEFAVHESTMELMGNIVDSGEFQTLTPERVFAEFKKGLMEDHPSRMYWVLFECGAAFHINEFFDILTCFSKIDCAAILGWPLDMRFAVVGGGFKKSEDYRKWTISSDCEDLSTIVNNNTAALASYGSMTPTQKVELFNRVDIFRRPDRFNKALSVVKQLAWVDESIYIDIKKVVAVDAGKIAAETVDKSKIKEAIFMRRVVAIS